MPARTVFRLHDDVQLVVDHRDVRSGAHGRILGWYARERGLTYLIRFGDQVCNDVRSDDIVSAADLESSA